MLAPKEKADLQREYLIYERKWRKLRLRYLDRAETDQGLQSELTELVKDDLQAWFNLMIWTFDPRPNARMKHSPMILYPTQLELLNNIETHYRDFEDLLIDKSRDMGVTYVFCGWGLHHWLFEEGFSMLFGSEKEEKVDNGTPEGSIFGKLDYIMARLPDWLPGVHEYRNTPRQRLKRPSILMKNPANGNVMQGESTNKDFSRSSRYSCILMDEFAFWDVDREAWASTSQSSPVRFPLSTPNGRGNMFADLRWPKSDSTNRIDVATLWWWEHPFKDDTWYQRERRRLPESEFAREVDISYEKSLHGRIYQFWDRKVYAAEEIDYEPGLPMWRAWDFGHGMTAILWIQVCPPHGYRVIDEYEKKEADIDHFAQLIADKEETLGYPKDVIDVGDPYGENRTQLSGGISVIERLGQMGLRVVTPPRPMCGYENRIRKTALILKHTKVSSTCTHFIECLENYKNRESNNPATAVTYRPLPNWASHMVTAFEFFSLMQPDPDLGDLSHEKTAPRDLERETAEWALNLNSWRKDRSADRWV